LHKHFAKSKINYCKRWEMTIGTVVKWRVVIKMVVKTHPQGGWGGEREEKKKKQRKSNIACWTWRPPSLFASPVRVESGSLPDHYTACMRCSVNETARILVASMLVSSQWQWFCTHTAMCMGNSYEKQKLLFHSHPKALICLHETFSCPQG
jgi:hypothetical protein